MRVVLLGLALVLAGSLNVAAPGGVMQEDTDHPVWDALRATGIDRAGWAHMLTTDADGNGMTDFLDLAASMAPGLRAEMLVYGPPAVLEDLVGAGGTHVPGPDAVFLTWTMGEASNLIDRGATMVVWEPRAYATASTNPAGGSPSSMPQHTLHQAGTAWSSYTGDGTRIAILDTGADPGHDALDGGKITSFKDCTSSATTSYDDHGHGTHVASTAAGDDGGHFRGIAYEADLDIVKLLDGGGSGTLGWFSCAVNHVRNNGNPVSDVASMSAGLAVPPLGLTTLNGGELDLFGWDREATRIVTGGVPFAVAAGNWIGTLVEVVGADESSPVGVNGVNQVSSPAFAPAVVAVGAVDRYGAPTSFTAIGPGPYGSVKPDVAAMGFDTWGALEGTGSWYEPWPGTSMATPLVAGAMAIMKEKNSGLAAGFYKAAVVDGAGPACLVHTGSCVALPEPNFQTGHGVLRTSSSLAFIP